MPCSDNRSASTSNEDSYVRGLGGVGLVAQERQQELLVHALVHRMYWPWLLVYDSENVEGSVYFAWSS